MSYALLHSFKVRTSFNLCNAIHEMCNLHIFKLIANIYVMDSGNVPVEKMKPFVITTTALVFFIVFLVINLYVCIQVRFVMELRIVLQEKMNIYVSFQDNVQHLVSASCMQYHAQIIHLYQQMSLVPTMLSI